MPFRMTKDKWDVVWGHIEKSNSEMGAVQCDIVCLKEKTEWQTKLLYGIYAAIIVQILIGIMGK